MPSFSMLRPKAASEPVPGSGTLPSGTQYPRVRDPNAPDYRLLLATKCIYERQMPGGSYITAHIERLQAGYYDSPAIHDDCIENVRFLAIRFTFHEASTERRFKAATIRLAIHDENLKPPDVIPLPPQLDHPDNHEAPPEKPREKPRFLRYAPHLLYGAMSPETLDWNFNLAGSIGVAQTPVTASLNPSGGVKSSYKLYKMMKIQGSLRTNSSWYGQDYDIEDGEVVWTLEENDLQKSGLPREFTFVIMLTKGDARNDVRFDIEIQPEVAAWFGAFPQWWVHFLKYQPLHKTPLNLDTQVGQCFQPCDPQTGYNFASLMGTFNDFVSMPGTTFSANDPSGNPPASPTTPKKPGDASKQPRGITQSPAPMEDGNPSNTLHLRIHLDQDQKQTSSMSANVAKPEPRSKSQRSPPAASTPSPKPSFKAGTGSKAASGKVLPPSANTPSPKPSFKTGTTSKASSGRVLPPSRRVTIDDLSKVMKTTTPTPPKYKVPRVTPLQTHYEEKQSTPPRTKMSSDEESLDHDYEYSFPETLRDPSQPRSTPGPLHSAHRHEKSTSTTSSSAQGPHSHAASSVHTPGGVGAGMSTSTVKTPLSAHHSLRRTRSRSGLRTASLTSQPEDEEAIAAAMDMLSGSPPPPAPAPPASAPATLLTIPSDDIVPATPRHRAALADRLEVDRAEGARIERRNGNLNTELNRPPHPTTTTTKRDQSAGRRPVTTTTTSTSTSNTTSSVSNNNNDDNNNNNNTNYVTDRSRERERDRNREKRYSLPITSTSTSTVTGSGSGTGTGYPNPSTWFSDTTNHPITTATDKGKSTVTVGNGRSSLMIPIGSKRDTGLGIGVGNGNGNGNGNGSGNRNSASGPNPGPGSNVTGGLSPLGVGGEGRSAAATGSFRRDGNSGVYSGYEYVDPSRDIPTEDLSWGAMHG